MSTDDEVAIDFLDGNGWQQLTERERLLMDKAREAGYQRGYDRGYVRGGQDAMRAATELTTLLSDRRWLRAVDTLQQFAARAEDESGSAYWSSQT